MWNIPYELAHGANITCQRQISLLAQDKNIAALTSAISLVHSANKHTERHIMKNTRTGQRTIRKLLKGAGSAILLATLFVLVFAGTLSGAFGIEENLQQNGIIESNVADATWDDTAKIWTPNNTFTNYNSTTDANNLSDNYPYTYTNYSRQVSVFSLTGGGGTYYYQPLVSNAQMGFSTNKSGDRDKDFWWGLTFNGSIAKALENGAIGDVKLKSDIGVYNRGGSDFFKMRVVTAVESGVGTNITVGNEVEVSKNKTGEASVTTTGTDLLANSASFASNSYSWTVKLNIWESARNYSCNGYVKSFWVDIYRKDTTKPTITHTNGSTEFTFNDATAGIYKIYASRNGGEEFEITPNISDDTKTATWTADKGGVYKFRVVDNVANTLEQYEYVQMYGTKTSSPFELTCREDFETLACAINRYGKAADDTTNWVSNGLYGSIFNVVPNSDHDQNTAKYGVAAGKYINMLGTAFTPIANYIGNNSPVFRGTINGDNCALLDLVINATNARGALVGTLGNGGAINDLTIGAASDTKSKIISTSTDAAAFVGFVPSGAKATISGCVNYAEISSSKEQDGGIIANTHADSETTIIGCVNNGKVSGSKIVGGIIGFARGTIIINGCSNNGEVGVSSGGSGDDIGGIAGQMLSGTISGTTTNNGTVTSTGGEHIGGIVGYALNVKFSGTLTNNGTVSATSSSRVGGVIGYFKIDGITDKTLSGATNSGDVSGGGDVGGIVGVLEGAIIDGATNSGTVTAEGNDVGGIVGWNVSGATVTGTLTNSGNVDGKTNDNVDGKTNDNVGGIVGYNTGTINGTFAIDNIPVKGRSSVGGVVGFNDTDGSVTISGVSNVGATLNGASYVGGVIGYSIGALSLTSSATNNATVTATGDYAGGFFAYVKKSGLTFSNLTNNAAISGVNYIGGIFGGIASSMTITNCTNNATVTFNSNVTTTSSNEYAGGIIGGIFADDSVSVTIEGCANTKDITATSNVGGILGGVVKDTDNITALNISKCANSGKITSKADNTGGIVGRAYTKTVSLGTNKLIIHIFNCYNVGEIARADDADTSTGDSTGGIVGYLYAAGTNASAALVEYCYNYSNVTGRKCVAGIVGGGTSSGYFTIDHCYVVVDNDHKLTAKANTIGAIVGGAYNGEVLSNYKVTNSWGFFPLNANNTGFNTLGKVFFTNLTLTAQVRGNTWTDVAWTDILSKNINGFKVSGTTAVDKYASSIWGESSVSSSDYLFTNVAAPTLIETSATANKGSVDVAQTDSAIEFTFYYDASFTYGGSEYANANGVRAEVKDIAFKQRVAQDQTKEYNDQLQVVTNPITPQIVATGGYGRYVVYFDDQNRTLNRTEHGKQNAGEYYYTYDIVLGGAVVGRYNAKFTISKYNLNDESKTFGEDFWFGAKDSVVVTNQEKYNLEHNEGTASLFLLNGSSTERPQVLVYQKGSYDVNSFVLYIKYTIIGADGKPSTVVKSCDQFNITQFVAALNSGEHVREGTQITAEGTDTNIVGNISRYYTLLDSDFGWRNNTTTVRSWGTKDNPYVISSQAQLLRLSQIINGAKAWNSIDSGDSAQNESLVLAADSRTVATDRTYANAHFVVTANILLDSTFKPIGNSGVVFKAACFASDTEGTCVEISYCYNNHETDYVGLFGNVEGTYFKDLYVVGASYNDDGDTESAQIVGKDYVGGLVGKMIGGTIDNCTFSCGFTPSVVGHDNVGGFVGYAEGTTVLYDTTNDKMDSSDNLVNARVQGHDYVGGIVGKWIITSAAQFNANGTKNEDGTEKGKDLYFSATGNVEVTSSGSYAGAIAGKLDASQCADVFNLNARLYYNSIDAKPYEKAQVIGVNYVGALYGSFIGNGTDKTTLTYADDYLHATVKFGKQDDEGNSEGSVIGGIIGYLQDATLAFANNYTVGGNAVKIEADSGVTKLQPSFFGGIIGVLGEGANIANGAAINDGNRGAVTLANELTFGTSTAPFGDFVGGIIGYVSSGAGKDNNGSTIFGGDLKFVNNGKIYANNYVGGIIGAIGIIDGYKNGDTLIFNNIRYGSTTATPNANIVTFKPSSAQNIATVYGADYVGGLVGGVFKKALLYLENKPVNGPEDSEGKLTFAIYNKAIVSGDMYVGGIVGYLEQESHVLNRIVNIGTGNTTDSNAVYVGKDGASYVGGLVGRMIGGTISNSVSASESTPNSESDLYRGSKNVGGLVGYMQGGTLENSISTGFKFDGNTDITKGGVAGGVLSPIIEGSWTIYIATYSNVESDTNYAYRVVSNNKNGKYILLDKDVISEAGSFNYVLAMAGVCQKTVSNDGNYTFKQGELQIGATYSTIGDKNQLAFYDASGSDAVMDTVLSRFESKSAVVYMGVPMYDGTSFSVCKTKVVFKDIARFLESEIEINPEDIANARKIYNLDSSMSDEAVKTYLLLQMSLVNVAKGYQAPSGAKYSEDSNLKYAYYADVVAGGTRYDSNGYITNIKANIYFKGVIIGTSEADVNAKGQVGDYDSGNLELGSEQNPYTISTQNEWNEFAWSIYSGTNTYTNAHIKLLTDVTVTKSASHTGINNATYTFGSLTTNTGKGAYATDNVGYNFAGSIANNNTGGKSFQGHFDGNGKKITITYTSGNYHNVSVFPNAKGASFKNLTIEGYIVAGSAESETRVTTGNGLTNDQTAKLEYNAASDIAGFVGKPLGDIKFENCTNNTDVIGYSRVAGFAGFSTSDAQITFIGCVNKGNIESLEGSKFTKNAVQEVGAPDDYSYGTGGLIAYATNDITIESCLNTGKIKGKTKVGGLVGRVTAVTNIQNSANTGHIEATEYNIFMVSSDSDYDKKRATNAWSRVGGIIGEAGKASTLNMFACYNTGHIRGLSNIAGGLVGIIGTIPDDKKSTSAQADHMATIAYSYNTGKIIVGYKSYRGIPQFGSSGYNFNGSLAGGIVGVAVQLTMRYCYNTGDIDAYGGNSTRALTEWQSRNGGILAEAATESGVTHEVKIENCYSVGKIRIMEANKASSETHYSADIVGFIQEDDTSKANVTVNNSYGIANNIINKKDNKDAYYSGWNNQDGGSIEKVRTGETLENLAQLTAVMKSGGTVGTIKSLATTWNASKATIGAQNTTGYKAGSSYGYIYLPGCLPQLAVFAVDTYNGLSMNSQNYGYDDNYGSYRTQDAGDEYSPYVIRDGIDLLGLQALVDLGYTFSGKYIEFANGTNNITLDENMASDTALIINLPTDGSTSRPSATAAYKFSSKASPSFTTASDWKTGKSYHLFALGGVLKQDNTSTNTYNAWKASNHAYGTNGTLAANAAFDTQNFLPIGRKGGNNVFKGTISGEWSVKDQDGKVVEKGVTEIANLRIAYKGYAGLFGNVQDAEVRSIGASGSVIAYANGTSVSSRSIAGGIVAAAYGSSIIDGCEAGSGNRTLEVYAYGTSQTYSDSDIENITTAAGGIVGRANTAKSGLYYDGTTLTVKNNKVVNAKVQSAKDNIGGIIGYVYATYSAKNRNNRVEIASNLVQEATISAIPFDTALTDVGTRTGGILGYSNLHLSIIVRECVVGDDSAANKVNILGENRIGGIVGETPDAVNEISGCKVLQSATIKRGNSWGDVSNAGEGGTAIGGIVGLTFNAEGTDPITTTFSGNIVFKGKIVIDVQTKYNSVNDRSNDGVVRNVGGIVGDMGSGARIATGSEIEVGGTIEIAAAVDTDHFNRNIGGVAGRTDDVAFSGTFKVAPTITAKTAYQIGGFIGKNNGIVNILADDTDIQIGGNITASHDVGGFIGYNNSKSTLLIGADQYRAVNYDDALSIRIVNSVNDAEKKATIDTLIKGTGDNVGGIVGNSAEGGVVKIVKGVIVNAGQVAGNSNIGGIIGYSDGALSTGGSNYGSAILQITNEGKVVGEGDFVGGVIGRLNSGRIAGRFVNKGNVKGRDYVGGSIGYVAKGASIESLDGKTEFINEAVAVATQSDALVAADNAVADDSKFNVVGINYVGGSIGMLLGQSLGNEQFKVEFRSKGTVNGEKYVGGSIGVLAGKTGYTDFISEGAMLNVGATTAVGGSVGFIGVPNSLVISKNEKERITSANIVVSHTHFEANGILQLLKATEKPSADKEYVWGGIGGAIGAIGNKDDNLFDNTNSDKWTNNTYYARGTVTAEGYYHVGGIVGLIKADNITIANMLAYGTTVVGGKNVGGIVGATIGKKTVIDSAYSISPDSGGGIFTATDGNAGGIIGLARVADSSNGYKAEDDTDASTSYWVKGYTNAELAGSSVTNLQTTLGRYRLAFETYNQEGKTVTVVFTKELIGTGATTTDASTSDDTTTGGDDTDEEVAIYPTPYAYYESVGTHSVKIYDGTTVTYTASEDEANENEGYVLIDENLTWQEYFDITVGKDDNNKSKITYEEKVGAWVETVSDWKQYSTGTKATGWYFVYSKDQNGENNQIGTISAKHTVSTADGYSDLWYWKRIANAYTLSERNAGYDDDSKANSPYAHNPLYSVIVRESVDGTISTVPHKGTLYATATAANFKNNPSASGYYMYIASSGNTKPTSVNHDGKFFIQAEGGVSQNVAVYYRSIAMGSALTYNGYERYAPISLSGDIKYDSTLSDQSAVNPDNKNSYFYNAVNKDNETPKIAKTYYTTVSVYYFDDEGKPYVVGGINEGAWRINKRELTLAQKGMDTKYIYGEKYESSDGEKNESGGIITTLTLQNVVSPDKGTFKFTISITDGNDKELAKITWDPTVNPNVKITQNSQEITVANPKWENVENTKAASDKKYTINNESDGKAYGASFNIIYKMAKTYKVKISNNDISDKTNYQVKNTTYELTVERRSLSLTLSPTSAQFNNSTHTATWTIGGKGILATDNVATVLSQFAPTVYAVLGDDSKTPTYSTNTTWTNVGEAIELKDSNNAVIAKFEVSGNTIKVSQAKNVGSYYIVFGKPSDDCNYKFESEAENYTPGKFTISVNTLTVTWSTVHPNGYHTYDSSTVGQIIATIKPESSIQTDYKTFVLDYFTQNLSGTKLDNVNEVSGQTAIFTFVTSVNATTYSVGLKSSGKVSDVNCRVEYKNATNNSNGLSTKTYKINPKELTLNFVGMPQNGIGVYPNYTYNTKAQGLSSIEVDGICGSDSVYLTVASTMDDNTISVASNGKVSNRKLNVTLAKGFINANLPNESYGATVTLGSGGATSNYVLSGPTSTSWKISPKKLTIADIADGEVDYDATAHYPSIEMTAADTFGVVNKVEGKTGVFTYGDDTITVNYTDSSQKGVFVNAGIYTISVASQNTITATRNNVAVPSTNYSVVSKPNNQVTFTINAATVEIIWNTYDRSRPFVYKKNVKQGLTIASLIFTANGKSETKPISGGKFEGYGNDKLIVGITDGKINAGTGYTMEYDGHSLVAGTTNSGIAPIKENYSFTGGLVSGKFNIDKSILKIERPSGGISKVYDATQIVPDEQLKNIGYTISSTNGGEYRSISKDAFNISAKYNDKNVASGIAITFTYSLKSTYDKNYAYATSTEDANIGTITPATITVTLDKLRNGRATRAFGENSGGINVFYGGAKGAVNGVKNNKSNTYRLGEGFTISGFPSAETSGVVKVLARYVEVGKDRAAFDGYVNFVYNNGTDFVKGRATDARVLQDNLFKSLVFSIEDCKENSNASANYNFKVVDTDGKTMSSTIGTSETSVTVYDSQDTKNKDRGESSQKITIEITVKTYKIKYDNTTQSYANADGTYNTKWEKVVAVDVPDDISVTVENGWMEENGAPKIYKEYTVIRGSQGNKKLSASVTGENGKQLNYNMTNQPVLTIGYFVEENSDTFEIGSLSSLLIASYYWWVSANSGDPEFNQVVNTTVTWVALISDAEYEAGAAFTVPSNAPVPPETANVKTWDGYFEWLETEAGGNHVVFLNETGEENERGTWGYYYTTTTGAGDVKKYSSFKQIRDINGTFTQSDIEMLDGFFRVYDETSGDTVKKEWGNGGEFITNFLKVGVGNVAVAIGSIFKSLENGFTGTYDGGGYVIEYFNIMSFVGDNSTENNVGMFDVLGGNATVKNLHLRNFSITSDKGNVGGIAGKALTGANAIENVSWHGTISMSGDGNVGGLIGLSARSIDKAIALGTINAKGGNIGGLIGSIEKDSSSQANVGVSNAVSFVYIDATGNVGAITASSNGATATNAFYLANSAWTRSSGALAVSNGTYGTAKTYTQLIDGEAIAGVVNVGSRSGYVADTDGKKYYQGSAKGVYDVLDDFDYANQASDSIKNMNARQSLRLKDIIDVYMLMYDIKETVGTIDSTPIKVYTISSSSWLVGTGHGTDSSKIEISNRQQVALLRELRFASFILTADVVATATSVGDYAYSGAFFGSVTVESGKSYTIDFGSGKSAFEKEANENSVPYKQNTQTV